MASDNSEQFALLNHLAHEFAARYRRGERPVVEQSVSAAPLQEMCETRSVPASYVRSRTPTDREYA